MKKAAFLVLLLMLSLYACYAYNQATFPELQSQAAPSNPFNSGCTPIAINAANDVNATATANAVNSTATSTANATATANAVNSTATSTANATATANAVNSTATSTANATATANTVNVNATTTSIALDTTATANAVSTANAVNATATANAVNAAATNAVNATATANAVNSAATADAVNAAATTDAVNSTATANAVNSTATANAVNSTAIANAVNAAATADAVNAAATTNTVNSTATVNAAATTNAVNSTATAPVTNNTARNSQSTLHRSNACCKTSTATATQEQTPQYMTTQTPGQAKTSSGVLAYTRYNIEQNGKVTQTSDNVKQVAYTYTTGMLTLATTSTITTLPSADGIVTMPDGSLVIGGKEATWKVDPKTGAKQRVNAGRNAISDHVTYDSQNNVIWTSGDNPLTTLAKIPLTAFTNGTSSTSSTRVSIKGNDTVVSAIAFDGSHHAYYTSGDGAFGTINLTTFTTTRKLSYLPAAHGMIYDPFTNTLILAGANHITQIDVNTLSVISDWAAPAQCSGLWLDQNATDGQGHMWATSNDGNLVFIDFSQTRKVADPKNYVSIQHLDTNLDDITLKSLN